MTVGELRATLEGVPDDRVICVLQMVPGTFYAEVEIRRVDPTRTSSGDRSPMVGMVLGEWLNRDSLGGY